ncbi:hypothetical protein [Caballeronia sp. GAFFF1]|uniref:hypothetical protein n=1 Tax=Caballeronia sp. GAFFF1 TaxID=2921779 RepID=UPI002028A8A7|nr:hypothetical protein [Caballeronia sp. GAFFF1]
MTPALAKKYFDLAQGAKGGVFPIGTNRFWHGGVHLKGTKPIRAIADGTVVAYRLDTDYIRSALDAELKECFGNGLRSMEPRAFSASFVLIRHECERDNGVATRYVGAHFYSLYANLLPARYLSEKPLLPPFLTTGENLTAVSALRGDELEILAVVNDGHRMAKVRVTDINTGRAVDGWIESMYLDQDMDGPAAPLTQGKKVRLGYPISGLYPNHPSERNWRPRDAVKTLTYPIRAGEIIGYAGQSDGPGGVLRDTFHFEIFTADNVLVKPMKPIVPASLLDPASAHQEYLDGSQTDGMGKVWLTRNASLMTKPPKKPPGLQPVDVIPVTLGSCFVAAGLCNVEGAALLGHQSQSFCIKLYDLDGKREFYAYTSADDALADGKPFVADAWVTLTTDSDWVERGWQAYKEEELSLSDDASVEDFDAALKRILEGTLRRPAPPCSTELLQGSVDAILRHVAVRFHTEWDNDGVRKRYKKLKAGEHPPLPKLTDDQFNAFLKDAGTQQFWEASAVCKDGVSGQNLAPLKDRMKANHWHFHPIGFLAQMRECMTTNALLSEEDFELEVRRNCIFALKLIEKRLERLVLWRDSKMPLPSPPTAIAPVERQYANMQNLTNAAHHTLWENFIYWFGVDPNAIVTPATDNKPRTAMPAGHHVYLYMQGMRDVFKHLKMNRIVKGSTGFDATAYVHQGYPTRTALVPAKSGFNMECIHLCVHYGRVRYCPPYEAGSEIKQNRMQVLLHEVSHMVGTSCTDDKKIEMPSGSSDPWRLSRTTAYGEYGARVLAEFSPELALANAENVAFFIESAKDEPV